MNDYREHESYADDSYVPPTGATGADDETFYVMAPDGSCAGPFTLIRARIVQGTWNRRCDGCDYLVVPRSVVENAF